MPLRMCPVSTACSRLVSSLPTLSMPVRGFDAPPWHTWHSVSYLLRICLVACISVSSCASALLLAPHCSSQPCWCSFQGRGLAEITRLILAEAGVKYEDVRLTQDEWKNKLKVSQKRGMLRAARTIAHFVCALQESTPWGQMPLLEVDGKVLAQSAAINRFLAREHGLYGANNWEAGQIDSVLDALQDAFKAFNAARGVKDEKEKAAAYAKYYSEDWPAWGKKLQAFLAKNGEGKGFLVGDKVSIADIYAYYMFQHLTAGNKDALNDFPLLAAHSKRISERERIAHWVATRPKSEW